jgi:amidase
MQIVKDVHAALVDARQRLADTGWTVEEIEDVPSVHAAAEVQEHLWLGDSFTQVAQAAQREGDPGALAVIAAVRARAEKLPPDIVSRALVRRATLTREWQMFFARYPVLLLPVSGELPFPDELDLQGNAAFERVWEAQLLMRAIPAMGLPGLSVAAGFVGSTPVGVQLVATRYREDLCLLAGEAIEARGRPITPIDPQP